MDSLPVQALARTVGSVKQVVSELGQQTEALNAISGRLSSGKIYAAMVGLINSGKSTTLNALVKQQVLPISVQVQTAAEVQLVHDPKLPEGQLVGRKRDGAWSTIATGVSNAYGQLISLNQKVRDGEPNPFDELVLNIRVPFLSSSAGLVLHISDTAGADEVGSPSVSLGVDLALEKFSAFIIVLNYRNLKSKAESELLMKLKALHPKLFHKQDRILLLVNAVDTYYSEGSKESISPAGTPHYVATYLKETLGLEIPETHIIPFSAKWALQARLCLVDPATMDDDLYDEAKLLFKRAQLGDVSKLHEPTVENKVTISKGLESFSGIVVVEEKLLAMLGQFGPKIICQSVVDDALKHVANLKVTVSERQKTLHINDKQAALNQQQKTIQALENVVSLNTPKLQNIPNNVTTSLQAQINSTLATLKGTICNQINAALAGHLSNVHNQEVIGTVSSRICSIKGAIVAPAKTEMANCWNTIMGIVRSTTATTLQATLTQFSSEIQTASANRFNLGLSNLGSVPPAPPLTIDLSADANPAVSDANLSSHVVSSTLTKYREVHHKKKKGRRKFGAAGPRHTVRWTTNEPYNVTVYSPNVPALQGAFASLVDTWIQQFRAVVNQAITNITSSASAAAVTSVNTALTQPRATLQTELQKHQTELQTSQKTFDSLSKMLEQLRIAAGELKVFD